MTPDALPRSAQPVPTPPLRKLDHDACLRLLSASEFGRLAVLDGDKPTIIILNHTMDGPDVIFRTTDNSRLARLTCDGRRIQAAFEVDSAFAVERSGWSVIVTGLLGQETDPQHRAAARARITAWADGERDTALRLVIQDISGRQVGPL